MPESGAVQALHDAIFDAVLVRTGILKWTAYERTKVVTSQHSGQSWDALIGLDEIGEVADLSEDADGALSWTLKRRLTSVDIRLEAVPRGAFLIHPNATCIDDSPLVGEALSLTRSELVSQGYDKATVWGLRSYDKSRDPDATERRDEDDPEPVKADVSKEMEQVRVWDCYVRIDQDGDGIAETHRVVLAEGGDRAKADDSARVVLRAEPVAEVPYAEVLVEREAHQFEGHSIAEDLIDVQRVKTALLRETLDNLYWQNSPQPYVQPDAVMDLEAIYNPLPRKPVLLKSGRSAEEAVQWMPIPFTAEKSFGMLDYFDKEAKDRTGIADASGGIDPDALQNVTAMASALANDAAVAQAEMMMRSIVRGIKRAFEGLLRLVVAHADRPRTIRLRGEWHEFDPRSWDAEMSFSVNIGLGAGSRDRDLTVLQMILQLQQGIMTGIGASNPLVKPDQLYNTLAKIAETAGFPSADPYFTRPDPAEIQSMMQAQQNQPDPAQIKAQEAQAKAQVAAQMEQIKAQARAQVEQAQMQADLVVEQARIAAEKERARDKLEADATMQSLKAELDLYKHRDQMALEWAKLGQQAQQAQYPRFEPGSVIDAT